MSGKVEDDLRRQINDYCSYIEALEAQQAEQRSEARWADAVDHPAHYTSGDIECIDAIRAALGHGFVSYCRGNAMKYIWRCGKKDDIRQDLAKAAWYLEAARDYLNKLAGE